MMPSCSYIRSELIEIDHTLRDTLNTRVKMIQDPLQEMINSGGKRLRPIMVLTSAQFGEKYDFERIKPLAVAMELIHMATLVHDDVIDDSPMRRGKPSVQASLGKDVAVFTGDYIFSKVFELLASTHNSGLLEIASKVLYKICEGEIKQREELFDTKISFKDYLYRIQRKTAILFSLSCHIGSAASEASSKALRALRTYGSKMGVAFQMIDDLLDINGDEKSLGKPLGADIREGVVTLPAIYALSHSKHKDVLEELLKKGDHTEGDIETAIDIIVSSGGVEHTERIAMRYVEKAKISVGTLPDHPVKDILLDIADYVLLRES